MRNIVDEFSLAANKGHLDIVIELYGSAAPEIKAEMIDSIYALDFTGLGSYGRLEVLKWYRENAPLHKWMKLVAFNHFAAFRFALRHNHFAVGDWFLSTADENTRAAMWQAYARQEMYDCTDKQVPPMFNNLLVRYKVPPAVTLDGLAHNHYEPMIYLAVEGTVEEFDRVFNLTANVDIKRQMLAAGNYAGFRTIAGAHYRDFYRVADVGNIEKLNNFLDKAVQLGVVNQMVAANDYSAIVSAARDGRIEIVKAILTSCDHQHAIAAIAAINGMGGYISRENRIQINNFLRSYVGVRATMQAALDEVGVIPDLSAISQEYAFDWPETGPFLDEGAPVVQPAAPVAQQNQSLFIPPRNIAIALAIGAVATGLALCNRNMYCTSLSTPAALACDLAVNAGHLIKFSASVYLNIIASVAEVVCSAFRL